MSKLIDELVDWGTSGIFRQQTGKVRQQNLYVWQPNDQAFELQNVSKTTKLSQTLQILLGISTQLDETLEKMPKQWF